MSMKKRKCRWLFSCLLLNCIILFAVKSLASMAMYMDQTVESKPDKRQSERYEANKYNQSKILYDASQLETTKCSQWNASVSLPIVPLCRREWNKSYQSPKIVMFTSAEDNIKRRIIHSTTLNLWKQLPLTPVLFLGNPRKDIFLLREACKKGWDVFTAPFCNGFELPVLRSMFEVAQKEYPEYDFYGYANSDMLFDTSLVQTLALLGQFTKSQLPSLLVTGRRTQIKVTLEEPMSTWSELGRLRKLHGSDGFVVAEDFFITRSDFAWGTFPPVVIGRRGFDNFLLYFANKQGYTTVDASGSLMVVHLGGTEDYAASHKRNGASINMAITGKFDFTQGLVSCANLRTVISDDGSLALYKVTKKSLCGQKDWAMRKKHYHEMVSAIHQEKILPQ